MKRILAHICCGPCSIYPMKKMLEARFGVYGFFYNPNIHPLDEFQKRLSAVKKLSSLMAIDVLYHEEYDPVPYLKCIRDSTKDERCYFCYALRLEKTAETAKKCGFDFFTSSLLYSKRQKHDLVMAIGLDIEQKYGISFYYEDFRIGWGEGIETSKRLGLYRQIYCGCIFSKIERTLQHSKFGPALKS